jgi:hypothetical protein
MQAVGYLHTLWDIREDSFRMLVQPGFPPALPGAGTKDDLHLHMLGDDLITGPALTLTRASNIDAALNDVWPWVAQMMRGAGVYGWNILETPEHRSADYLLSGLGAPEIGDHVGDVLEIARVHAPREIVWRASGGVDLLGLHLTALTLDYLLRSTANGRCRIVVRMRGSGRQLTSQVCSYLFEVLDFVLPASQLATLKDYIETYEQRLAVGDTNRSRVQLHQAVESRRAAQQAGSR